MREILFRGKRIDNGEWVDGNLLASELPVSGVPNEAFIAIPFGSSANVELVKVDPETVCEWCGKKDRAKEYIFDGSFVENDSGTLGLVYWNNRESCWDIQIIDRPDGGDLDGFQPYRWERDLTVLGNKFDHPSLLTNDNP